MRPHRLLIELFGRIVDGGNPGSAEQDHEFFRGHPRYFGGPAKGQMIPLEEMNRQRAMDAEVEKPFIEGHGQDRGPSMLRDENEMSLLRVLE